MSAPDFANRKKVLTVYLPIELGVFNRILSALEPMIPGETPFGSIVESTPEYFTVYSTPEYFTVYAPEDVA